MFRCQANIIIVFIVCTILAVVTSFSNATVLIVIFVNKKLRNGQGVYRLSLAFADLIVGLIVFPTFISSLYQTLHVRPEFELGPEPQDLVTMPDVNISIGEAHRPDFFLSISRPYVDAVGFFTTLSILVSIYTLVAAAVDRLVAIKRGLHYRRPAAIAQAQKAVGAIWISATIFSLFPFFLSKLEYHLVYSILVGVVGENVIAVVIAVVIPVIFIVPLILMWVITSATFVMYKLYVKNRKDLNISEKKDTAKQIHLLITLSIMVGVFTACVLPQLLFLFVYSSTLAVDLPEQSILGVNNQSFINAASAEVVISMLVASNSLWNFFIYSARDKKFRKATKNLFKSLLTVFKNANQKE